MTMFASAHRKVRHLLRIFSADRRANVAITFAIAVIPIAMAVGAAVDYSFANRDWVALNGYADMQHLSTPDTLAVPWRSSRLQRKPGQQVPWRLWCLR